jgi:hypothetical protein
MGHCSDRASSRFAFGVLAALSSAWAGGCGSSATPPATAAPSTPVAAGPDRRDDVGQQRLAVAPAAKPSVVARADAAANTVSVTQDEVVIWATQGTRDDVIIDRIERSRAVFRLSAADEQHLRQQGVSGDVIVAMKESCWR